GRIHRVPRRSLELLNIQDLAVWRNRHPVASSFIGLVPDSLPGNSIDRDHAIERSHIDPARLRAGRDALDVLGFFSLRHAPRGNAPHKLISLVDVEHGYADPAVFHIVARSRISDVQQMLLRRGW